MNTQTLLNVGAGVIGAIITYAFGQWSELLSFFLLAIIVDIITGVAASFKEGRGLSSAWGFEGLAKKGFMFLAILLAHRMDELMGTDVIMVGAIYAYLVNELISITENYGRLNLPLPSAVKRIIDLFKDQNSESTIPEPRKRGGPH